MLIKSRMEKWILKYSCNRILNNNENEETTASMYVFYKCKVEWEKQKAKNLK